MQIGIPHLIGSVIAIVLLLGSAFTVGAKWDSRNTHDEKTPTSVASTSDEILQNAGAEIPAPGGAPLYKVLRVVDGDTIVVEINGKSESLRLIGVDTPELNDSRTGVQCFGKESAAYVTSLVSGKNVRIESDPTQGERDKYKRILAYVFREDGVFLNRMIIQEGYGNEYTYNDPYKYQAQFKEAERQAKELEKGLWAPDVCPTQPKVKAVKKPAPQKAASQAASVGATLPTPSVKIETSVVPFSAPIKIPASEEASPPPPVKVETTSVPPPPTPQTLPPASAPEPPPPVSSSAVVCSVNSYNCTDFKTQQEAQTVYDQCGGLSNDIHKLDKNKDGSACDSLR